MYIYIYVLGWYQYEIVRVGGVKMGSYMMFFFCNVFVVQVCGGYDCMFLGYMCLLENFLKV